MNSIQAVLSAITILVFSLVSTAHGSETSPESLSPYFQVEGSESSLDSFPLKETSVNVTITGVIASVTVTQVYANLGSAPINGTYIFPGSTKAAVHAMTMQIGERLTRAKIKEKETARKIYESAKRQGKNASLLEQRRPNVFSMEVANVMPGDTLEIELRYTELLVPENGLYEFVYPTVIGPRYTTDSGDSAPPSERWVQNPYLKEGSDPRTEVSIGVSLAAGMPIQEISSGSHDIAVDFAGETRARISLSGQDGFAGDRDFILHYRLSGSRISTGLMLQQGTDENYFLLMAQPPARVEPASIPDREYLFVIDVSGSMSGYPLDTAKRLLAELLGTIRTTDSFNLLFFAGDSDTFAPIPVPATRSNIREALEMIDRSDGGGGTELAQAMRRAMSMEKRDGLARTMVVITDGYIHAEKEVFELIQSNLSHTNVFAFGIGSSVNRYLIEGMARSGQGEPFIVTGSDNAQEAVRRFTDYISSPVLTDITATFDGIDVYDVEPPALPDLFAERPVIMFGKWRGTPTGLVTLTGRTGEEMYRRKIPVGGAVLDGPGSSLGHLWARTRISRLSDFNSRRGNHENRDEIVALGLSHNLLTPFTSFIAVDEIVRNPDANGTDIKQPLTLPKQVSELAVGGGVRRVPEPGLALLAVLLLCMLILPRVRARRSTA